MHTEGTSLAHYIALAAAEGGVSRSDAIGWIFDFTGVFLGAVLGAYIGYRFSRSLLHEELEAEKRDALENREATRKALGRLLFEQMGHRAPNKPIYAIPSLPEYAPTLSVNAVDQLLAPGLIDAGKDDDLLTHLVHLSAVIQDFNDVANAFNTAVINDGTRAAIQKRSNLVQSAFEDYQKAHKYTMYMIQRLDPSIELPKDTNLP